MKKVTIVIPTYNRPDRLRRAVLSAINQTYEFLEVIVVDDNGRDSKVSKETKQSVADLIESKKIRYYCNQVNSGGSISRNVGLHKSSGEYITFLDDDDEINTTKVEKQVMKLEQLGDEYGAVYTAYIKLTANNKVFHSAETITGNVFNEALARSIYVGSGSNLLVRTAIAKSIEGYDIDFKRNQDLEFMTRVLKKNKLAYVNEELLTIHYEIREVKRSYQDLVNIDNFYVDKFKIEISKLSKSDQRNIYSIIALERFRYSIISNAIDGIKNLWVNNVKIVMIVKYLLYVVNRVMYKKTFGFKGDIRK